MGLKKEVIQTVNGEEIVRFPSAREAAKELNLDSSRIGKLCKSEKPHQGYCLYYSGVVTNAKEKENGDFKCPFCKKSFKTYNSLAKHIFRVQTNGNHEISKEELYALFFNHGVIPTCKCGCGEKVKLSYEGGMHFCQYIVGHHNRVHNNWGHNKKAIVNSAKTRARQFKDGTRSPWNKGKKWSEVFDEKQIEELKAKIYTDERNKKLSESLKGRELSEAHLKKLKEIGNTEWFKELSRKRLIDRINSKKFEISSKKEKDFIKECIDPLGIAYKTQYYIKEIKHYCDVYIPSSNLIIEFNGDYWHGNPRKYLFEDLTERQKKQVEKDRKLREYCQNNQIRLIEIWQSEFDSDLEATKLKISNLIGN